MDLLHRQIVFLSIESVTNDRPSVSAEVESDGSGGFHPD
jgi:hypothetical protein